MDRSDVLHLIRESWEMDDHNQQIPAESKRAVYCNAKSVTRTEMFEAGQNGHRAAWVFEVFLYDYEEEQLAEFQGRKYGIYRTYRANNDIIELYAEEKGGIR